MSGSTPRPSSRTLSPITASETASSSRLSSGSRKARPARTAPAVRVPTSGMPLSFQRVGEDFERAARSLVDDRHDRTVPSDIGKEFLAVALDHPERRRVADEEFGGVGTAATPAPAQVEHQAVDILERPPCQRFGDRGHRIRRGKRPQPDVADIAPVMFDDPSARRDRPLECREWPQLLDLNPDAGRARRPLGGGG